MSHTPGPWKLSLIDKWPFGVSVTGADGTEVFKQSAYCHSTKQKSRKDCEDGVGFKFVLNSSDEFDRESAINAIATQDANARLISAAPDLLTLAKYAVDNPDFSSEQFDKMARAAIAKALGE